MFVCVTHLTWSFPGYFCMASLPYKFLNLGLATYCAFGVSYYYYYAFCNVWLFIICVLHIYQYHSMHSYVNRSSRHSYIKRSSPYLHITVSLKNVFEMVPSCFAYRTDKGHWIFFSENGLAILLLGPALIR